MSGCCDDVSPTEVAEMISFCFKKQLEKHRWCKHYQRHIVSQETAASTHCNLATEAAKWNHAIVHFIIYTTPAPFLQPLPHPSHCWELVNPCSAKSLFFLQTSVTPPQLHALSRNVHFHVVLTSCSFLSNHRGLQNSEAHSL